MRGGEQQQHPGCDQGDGGGEALLGERGVVGFVQAELVGDRGPERPEDGSHPPAACPVRGGEGGEHPVGDRVGEFVSQQLEACREIGAGGDVRFDGGPGSRQIGAGRRSRRDVDRS